MALGHPIGATGAMLIGTALDELERTGGRFGLVTMCAAGGMAPAIIIERDLTRCPTPYPFVRTRSRPHLVRCAASTAGRGSLPPPGTMGHPAAGRSRPGENAIII